MWWNLYFFPYEHNDPINNKTTWHLIALTKPDSFGKFTTERKVCAAPGILLYAVNTTYTALLKADTKGWFIIHLSIGGDTLGLLPPTTDHTTPRTSQEPSPQASRNATQAAGRSPPGPAASPAANAEAAHKGLQPHEQRRARCSSQTTARRTLLQLIRLQPAQRAISVRSAEQPSCSCQEPSQQRVSAPARWSPVSPSRAAPLLFLRCHHRLSGRSFK